MLMHINLNLISFHFSNNKPLNFKMKSLNIIDLNKTNLRANEILIIDEDINITYEKSTFLINEKLDINIPQIKLYLYKPFFERIGCLYQTIFFDLS